MKYTIAGTTMQTLSIDLTAGENLYSQTASMAWMSDSIEMKTSTGGGLFSGLKRSLAGGTLFITDFVAVRDAKIAFAPRFPGTILPFALAAGESIVCRRESFLCDEKSVTFEIAFQQRFSAGMFGGEGFILQRVTGPGTVFLDLSGEVVIEELLPGQKLLVHAGHIGAQSPSIDFSIQRVQGFRNILFGGEGLFLASVTGPGKIWLQSMPIMNLAETIAAYLPSDKEGSASSGGAGNFIGGVIGGMMNRKE